MLDLRTDLQRLAAATAINDCVACRLYAGKYGVLNFIGEMPMAMSLKQEWEEHFKHYHAHVLVIDEHSKVIGPEPFESHPVDFLDPDQTPLLPL